MTEKKEEFGVFLLASARPLTTPKIEHLYILPVLGGFLHAICLLCSGRLTRFLRIDLHATRAVDEKTEQQKEFVRWWEETVTPRKYLNRYSIDNSERRYLEQTKE
jgi:hypothetical protein